jgi:hypothetical protein
MVNLDLPRTKSVGDLRHGAIQVEHLNGLEAVAATLVSLWHGLFDFFFLFVLFCQAEMNDVYPKISKDQKLVN